MELFNNLKLSILDEVHYNKIYNISLVNGLCRKYNIPLTKEKLRSGNTIRYFKNGIETKKEDRRIKESNKVVTNYESILKKGSRELVVFGLDHIGNDYLNTENGRLNLCYLRELESIKLIQLAEISYVKKLNISKKSRNKIDSIDIWNDVYYVFRKNKKIYLFIRICGVIEIILPFLNYREAKNIDEKLIGSIKTTDKRNKINNSNILLENCC